VYALRLHNGGKQACLLAGLPRLRLLGVGGRTLPTKVVADPRYKARPFVLKPGGTATAQARFSPDVPGKGESTLKACEPIGPHGARVRARRERRRPGVPTDARVRARAAQLHAVPIETCEGRLAAPFVGLG